jgi:hypothetical protein
MARRGNAAALLGTLKHALAWHFTIIEVYRSRYHYETGQVLCEVWSEGKDKVARELQWYNDSKYPERSSFDGRDANAAMNMRILLTLGADHRSDFLTRSGPAKGA